MSEPLNVPATIDVIHRQLDQARDIESVLEIHDRAEALREYCRRHDGLMEAGNRLAGITALCERPDQSRQPGFQPQSPIFSARGPTSRRRPSSSRS